MTLKTLVRKSRISGRIPKQVCVSGSSGKEKKGLDRGWARIKYCCIAETRQSREEHRATTSERPCLKEGPGGGGGPNPISQPKFCLNPSSQSNFYHKSHSQCHKSQHILNVVKMKKINAKHLK